MENLVPTISLRQCPAEPGKDDLQDRRLTTLGSGGRKITTGEFCGSGMKPGMFDGGESAGMCGLTGNVLVCTK